MVVGEEAVGLSALWLRQDLAFDSLVLVLDDDSVLLSTSPSTR